MCRGGGPGCRSTSSPKRAAFQQCPECVGRLREAARTLAARRPGESEQQGRIAIRKPEIALLRAAQSLDTSTAWVATHDFLDAASLRPGLRSFVLDDINGLVLPMLGSQSFCVECINWIAPYLSPPAAGNDPPEDTDSP